MVVIVIVAMLFTFMALSIRTNAPEDLIKDEAIRFNRLVQLLKDESILRNEDYGIAFGAEEYVFLRYAPDQDTGKGEWISLDDELFRLREMSNDIEIELKLEQSDVDMSTVLTSDDEKLKPQVFVLSSGEITPEFEAEFFIPTEPIRYKVIASIDGKHYAEVVE